MLDFKEIISAFLVLFAIIDITGSIPIFLSLKQSGNRFNPIYAALISLLIFVVFFFLGDAALRLFGVDIQSFAVAGSIVLFIMAFEMILGVEILDVENIISLKKLLLNWQIKLFLDQSVVKH